MSPNAKIENKSCCFVITQLLGNEIDRSLHFLFHVIFQFEFKSLDFKQKYVEREKRVKPRRELKRVTRSGGKREWSEKNSLRRMAWASLPSSRSSCNNSNAVKRYFSSSKKFTTQLHSDDLSTSISRSLSVACYWLILTAYESNHNQCLFVDPK